MREGDVNDILVENVDIVEPLYRASSFADSGTAYVAPADNYDPDLLAAADKAKYANVTLKNITITQAGTYGSRSSMARRAAASPSTTVSIAGSGTGPLDRAGPRFVLQQVGANPVGEHWGRVSAGAAVRLLGHAGRRSHPGRLAGRNAGSAPLIFLRTWKRSESFYA